MTKYVVLFILCVVLSSCVPHVKLPDSSKNIADKMEMGNYLVNKIREFEVKYNQYPKELQNLESVGVGKNVVEGFDYGVDCKFYEDIDRIRDFKELLEYKEKQKTVCKDKYFYLFFYANKKPYMAINTVGLVHEKVSYFIYYSDAEKREEFVQKNKRDVKSVVGGWLNVVRYETYGD